MSDQRILERRLHLNMTLLGGFMGGYAVLSHDDFFGSAQTTNMIALTIGAVSGPGSEWIARFVGLLIYIAGLASTVFISHKLKPEQQKKFSIVLDAMVLFFVGFLPKNLDIIVATYPIFFATAFQWCSFKGADGFVSSSIFSTNNLRQCVTGFTEYFYSHDTEALRRGIYFGKVLFSFYFGVVLASFSCNSLGLKGSWPGILFTVTAFMLCYSHENAYEQEKNLFRQLQINKT